MLRKWKAEAECNKFLSFFASPRSPVEFPLKKLRFCATPNLSTEVENKKAEILNIWFELRAG